MSRDGWRVREVTPDTYSVEDERGQVVGFLKAVHPAVERGVDVYWLSFDTDHRRVGGLGVRFDTAQAALDGLLAEKGAGLHGGR